MVHPMAEQYMCWKPIEIAPSHGKQILVGFIGQFGWIYYVAPAQGINTGRHMPFSPPTHWTLIVPPTEEGGVI